MNLAPHIRKWWDPANDRRQRLILKKYKGGGLSDDQELELVLLQGIAEMIMEFTPADIDRVGRFWRAPRMILEVLGADLSAKPSEGDKAFETLKASITRATPRASTGSCRP